MRQCPFCSRILANDIFACLRHWRMLTRDEQREIYDCYRAYMSDRIGVEELRERQQRVIDAVKGRLVEGPPSAG